jgi:hypothetical protein
MMFVVSIPYEEHSKVKQAVMSESEYFMNGREQLLVAYCPVCKEHELFRGGVYIGCTGCFNYFNEQEIIDANIVGGLK